MSLNVTKSGIVLEKIHSEQKISGINIMAVEENFDGRRKRGLVYSLDIPC